ncbi:MAG: site-specific DNA-methyltransferase, partial [Bacteroidales bacterium]|nr:site-specific DNA-methyltransferase [Bacteroidales bacterium]
MPEVFDEGKIDWEKLKATLGGEVNFANERYVLNWAGKSDAFRIMQQPSSATLVPCREESVDFDHTENIFIEGENMEVLKVLQKSYFGKVKMIYIDPPYNTGNDSFIYPDKFSETKEEYMKRVGDKDEEGYMTREGMFRKNSKENGQYHSNWLNMMMPRLYLAKSLLREDGVIFVSIDDNEVHNLRLLMNEIFGEENFVCQFIWHSRQNKDNRNINGVSNDHEYILCYAKQNTERVFVGTERKTEQYTNPDDDPRGPWTSANMVGLATADARPNLHYDLINPIDGVNYGCPAKGWRYDRNTMARLIEERRILWPENPNGRPRKKAFLSELSDNLPGFSSIIEEGIYTNTATKEIANMFGGFWFDFPKPTGLIKQLLSQIVQDDEIVLDFFAGSATTAHAVMQLNKEDGGHRKYICVQLPELCDEKSEAYKAGFKTIAEIGKERIRRAGAKIRAEVEAEQAKRKGQFEFEEDQAIEMPDLGFKVFKLSESNFKQWREIKGSNKEEWKQQMLDFINPVTENATTDNMVYELLLKSGKSLTSTIEHKNGYHAINGKELILMLEAATQETVDAILAEHPQKVLALDNLFEGNDQLKTNTALQMRDA